MEFVDHCEITQVHQGAVDQVRQVLPPDEVLSDLADLFKIFGDSTRIKILYALLRSELCVCDIADLLGLTQSAISHQLRVLRSSGASVKGSPSQPCPKEKTGFSVSRLA